MLHLGVYLGDGLSQFGARSGGWNLHRHQTRSRFGWREIKGTTTHERVAGHAGDGEDHDQCAEADQTPAHYGPNTGITLASRA